MDTHHNDSLYFSDEPEGEGVGIADDDDNDDSPRGSPWKREREREREHELEQDRHSPHWPQSYRQSMDIYSHMASPTIPLFSPLSTSRPSNSYLSPFITNPYRRSTPHMGEPDLPQGPPPLPTHHKPADRPPVPKFPPRKSALEDEEFYSTEPAGVAVNKSSYIQAVLNGVNVLAGVGVLSTPYAVMKGGWIGLSLLFVLSAICCYTGVMLRYCLDSHPNLATYPDIGEAAFGRIGRLLISVVLYVELYACCVEFLILEGDNLAAVFPSTSLSIGGFIISGRSLFVLISASCILPTFWLRDLSLLSYLSAGGVLATIVVFFSVLWVGTVDGVGFHQSGPLLNIWSLPVSIGLYGFCYSGHAVFPNIYMSLKDPNQFNNVLLTSFVICTTIYGGMAVMGFTMYGAATEAQITLNLSPTFTASQVAVWTTVVNPFTKFALTMTPVALSLEELLPMHPDSSGYRYASLFIRTMLVASTVMVALVVPYFGYVMAFTGAFLSMSVSVILPCACYIRILGKRASALQVFLCYSIMVAGFGCAIAGTYASVAGIVDSWRHTDTPNPPSNPLLSVLR